MDRLSGNSIGLNVELLSQRYREEIGPLADSLRELQGIRVVELAAAFDNYQRAQLGCFGKASHRVVSWLAHRCTAKVGI